MAGELTDAERELMLTGFEEDATTMFVRLLERVGGIAHVRSQTGRDSLSDAKIREILKYGNETQRTLKRMAKEVGIHDIETPPNLDGKKAKPTTTTSRT
jgi:hypothetical protein